MRGFLLWERPCVAKGLQSSPSNISAMAKIPGLLRSPSRHKAAPTLTAST